MLVFLMPTYDSQMSNIVLFFSLTFIMFQNFNKTL